MSWWWLLPAGYVVLVAFMLAAFRIGGDSDG